MGQRTFPFSTVTTIEGPQWYVYNLFMEFIQLQLMFSVISNVGHRIQLQETNHQIWLLQYYDKIISPFQDCFLKKKKKKIPLLANQLK